MQRDTDGLHTRRDEDERATAWLSHGLETLIDRLKTRPARFVESVDDVDFDVVIVGSGYGGAVALSELAGYCNADGTLLRVCLLERGKEYLPGSFPSRFADLAGHVRFSTPEGMSPRGTRDGLFDLRVGPDVCALIGNGLGGGSLINAGVMAWPHPSVFRESHWPRAIRDDDTLEQRALRLAQALGAERAPIAEDKHAALRMLGCGQPFTPVEITVASTDGLNAQGVQMKRCIGCGDCMTGCNHRAKASLDMTLLVTGRKAGAELVTGATVLKLGKLGTSVWQLEVVHTDDKLRRRQGEPFKLYARRVILAAGTFGSTEILMRSGTGEAGLKLSSVLGKQFSANGDSMAAIFDSRHRVNGVADEGDAYDTRGIGPTITGMIDGRDGDAAADLVIQDLGVPGPLRRLFEQTFAIANAIHALAESDGVTYADGDARADPNAVDGKRIQRSLLVALIGHDAAHGRLELIGNGDALHGDGAITVKWPEGRDDARFADRQKRLDGLAHQPGSPADAVGGRVLPNPLWRLIPDSLEGVLGTPRGPLVTVHPLGGCPMGEDSRSGVVDHLGRVFDGAGHGSDVHDGLVVIDGSIVPTSLGINPSLTIATLAQRAICTLRDHVWNLRLATPKGSLSPLPLVFPRPYFRSPPPRVDPRRLRSR